MNLLNISFYVLVGILCVAILVALVWTRSMRPDTTKDKLNKLTSYPLMKLKGIIKKIGRKNPNVFYNVLLSSDKSKKKSIYIPGIILSDENIYLIASPIFSDKKVSFSKQDDKYFFNDRDEKVDLKYNLWFDRASLHLANKLNISVDVFKMIIPTFKKTKNLKKIIKMEDLKENNTFKQHSEISNEIHNQILSLNILNVKGGRK